MSGARERVLGGFRKRTGREPTWLVRAPGRVNLLGEHVDYNDGIVLPAAIDRALWVAAEPLPGKATHLVSLDLEGEARITPGPASEAGWARPVSALANALSEEGLEAPGLGVWIASDLPVGGGLSSSAALTVAMGLAWSAAAGWQRARADLARICQQAENRHGGVHCGIMDPWIVLHGKAGHAVRLDCLSLESRALALPADVAIVVAESGVVRQLGQTGYNQRREECDEALRRLRSRHRELQGFRQLADTRALGGDLPAPLLRRVRHVVSEIARVEDVTAGGGPLDAARLGAAMVASHESLRDLYEVSIPELDALVEIAVGVRGCYGSRLTGAGFGGSTVSLVDRIETEAFALELGARYRARTGRTAVVWVCNADDGAVLEP